MPGPVLARGDLKAVVEQVQRIERERKAEVGLEEARALLKDLDMPAELLEEALARVRADRHAAAERKRAWALGAAVALLVAALVGAIVLRRGHSDAARLEIGAASALVAEGPSEQGATSFRRSASPELMFRVTLSHAPIGDELPLTCEWSAPDATVANHNSWTTKRIDRDAWPTHCRMRLTPSSQLGSWTVNMRQGDRTIATQRFEVKE